MSEERAEARSMPFVPVVVVACVAVLALGGLGKEMLSRLRKPPAEVVAEERPVPVEVMAAQPADVQVVLKGLGTAKCLDVVEVVPEVAGKVIEIHPEFEVGNVIPEGEVLFVIDPRTYEAALEEAEAAVTQIESSISRIETQMALDRDRLKVLERTRDLAEAEFARKKELYEKDQVGALSAVEAAEQGFNQAVDAVSLMEQALRLYPIQIREARGGLAAAAARRDTVRINLERTRVKAPFTARVRAHRLEVGQYVAPGVAVATLANDALLEISVPVDSRYARQWLPFNGRPMAAGTAWFSAVEPVACTIRWTEDMEGHTWEGRLERVEQFSQDTLMVDLAVRVEGANALSKDGRELPLVEGMSCWVEIPGRTMKGVFRLPAWAVTLDDTVYVAAEADDTREAPDLRRLRTTPVEVVREEGDFKYVSAGLAPGDLVVTTRLASPLEGSLLRISSEEGGPDAERVATEAREGATEDAA
ncbi:MAG: hypothetical protein JXR94_22355 [Candidatus Hydrogenedentes bacterium]|nr:hypothetical protein [Candidatus Hydrogenedentota bacterium]